MTGVSLCMARSVRIALLGREGGLKCDALSGSGCSFAQISSEGF